MATKRKARRVVRNRKRAAPEQMMDTMNQVWLAGLGAMSKARQGAPLLLQQLIAEGARVQTDTRESAEKMIGGLMGDAKATIELGVKQVRSQAGDTLDNLEQMFQTRVHRALAQLGVPSAEDVEKLSHKVEQLNTSINKLAADRRVVKTIPRARARATRIAHKRTSLGTLRVAAL